MRTNQPRELPARTNLDDCPVVIVMYFLIKKTVNKSVCFQMRYLCFTNAGCTARLRGLGEYSLANVCLHKTLISSISIDHPGILNGRVRLSHMVFYFKIVWRLEQITACASTKQIFLREDQTIS